MKLISKLVLACSLLAGTGAVAATAADQVLAFPGAEGFGRYTIGGRYGANGNGTAEIYHVTNLNDSGAGSLRDAVSKSGRIVVFDVCGTIYLKSMLVFSGNSTILGQTAPGEGVQVYGNRVSFTNANNLIVRHMRFRNGKDEDACGVANGENMIFDHVSALFGKDECFSVNWDNKNKEPRNITIQNSIIGYGLQTHSAGGLIQTNGNITLYRNLYIESATRNPKVKGINQFVNNVLYNWGNKYAYEMGNGSSGTSWAEVSDNYFVKGPWENAARPLSGGNGNFHYFGTGNYYDDNLNGVLDGTELSEALYNASGSDRVSSMDVINTGMANQTTGDEKEFPEIKGRQTATEALQWVLKNVGASLPAHDEVDRYALEELASYGKLGTKGGISTEKLLPHQGVGTIFGGFKPKDSDNDGIPDEWETANGLDPNDASDAVKINNDGYTNLESYVFTIDSAYPYVKNPTDLKASEINKTSVTLNWKDNADDETGFVIEMSEDSSKFSKIGEAAANATSFTASDLKEKTIYYFRLKALGNDIESVYSPTLKIMTDEPTAPKATTLTSPANGAKMRILNSGLSWSNSTEDYFGEVTYDVYLGTSNTDLKKVASNLTETSYTPIDLEVETTYYWRVDATNNVGTTQSAVYSFTVIDGGTLFYTDFRTCPEEWANDDFLAPFMVSGGEYDFNQNKAGTFEFEYGNLIVGSTGGRVHGYPTRTGEAASAEHAGASKGTIAFIGQTGDVTKNYVKVKGIEGPWTLTVYSYNTDGKSYSVDLSLAQDTDNDGLIDSTEQLTTFKSASSSKTKITKHTFTYNKDTQNGTIILSPATSGVGLDLCDILIEKFIPGEVEPLEIKSGKLVNEIDYTDGSVAVTFNQNIELDKSNVTIDGKHQFENINVSASGATITVSYEALDINSTYTITIPEGAVTDLIGTSWEGGDIVLKTGDFPAAKKSGETHWGKAQSTLPYDLVPFNSYASTADRPITPVGDHTQAKDNDFPHWALSGGGVTANSVSFKRVNKDDKVMAYFDKEPKKVQIKLECTSGSKGSIMVQETRNADITPGYRTLRVFTENDLPFDGELPLNPETRFIKVIQKTYSSGEFKLTALKISDEDLSGLDVIEADVNAPAEYYNLQGIRVENPGPGLYIVRQGGKTSKVLIK